MVRVINIDLEKEIVGKFKVEVGYSVVVILEGKRCAATIEKDNNRNILKFKKHYDFSFGKKINGFTLTNEQITLIENKIEEFKELEKNEENKMKEEFLNSKVKYELGLCGGFSVMKEFSSTVQDKVFDILRERNIKEERVGNSYCSYIIFDITVREVLEMLEKVKNELAKEGQIKAENKKKNEQMKIEKLKEIAKKTGKRQVLSITSDTCNDDNEACDIDTITEYINEDGTFTIERTHNW